MKEEEFNLSDRIERVPDTLDEGKIMVCDVKEFIRRLKDYIKDFKPEWVCEKILNEIDKLAGKELER